MRLPAGANGFPAALRTRKWRSSRVQNISCAVPICQDDDRGVGDTDPQIGVAPNHGERFTQVRIPELRKPVSPTLNLS